MGERGVAVVIEDDGVIRTALTDILRQSGFAVHPTSSGSEGISKVIEHKPDIVTVDIGLPDFDGIEVSRRIRTFSDAYVIIISRRADEADALMGFEAGADDYLIKPFRKRELIARVRAMFRRPRIMRQLPGVSSVPVSQGALVLAGSDRMDALPGAADVQGLPVEPAGGFDFAHQGLALHEGTRQVTVDGIPISLTRSQFDILLVLMENGRTVQTKSDLVRRLRNEPYTSGSFVSAKEERAVEVQVSNLRKRLGESSRRPRWIETVHGVGYRMTP
ncbi:DNA-binding response regulator, OmpR family, contains REC and winged-helix (wHTH) domain [Pseudarthrobacter equi]|uniref:DNA-binding response regulator, OmpR family, contains REC and winged-helix (WHTH) domain n=1 Tax=Pseudarthrobacter equi TaxID=728066 RepID=A0A1H2B368_9MICC|nr:response regulator transcription factor [Pseudarthrobacter equi]SDT52236.1 DNA-binding response regulator, OmpR family, contains REC and winged-helix (wHTH) domain [Pseudarthrobacter equi]